MVVLGTPVGYFLLSVAYFPSGKDSITKKLLAQGFFGPKISELRKGGSTPGTLFIPKDYPRLPANNGSENAYRACSYFYCKDQWSSILCQEIYLSNTHVENMTFGAWEKMSSFHVFVGQNNMCNSWRIVDFERSLRFARSESIISPTRCTILFILI